MVAVTLFPPSVIATVLLVASIINGPAPAPAMGGTLLVTDAGGETSAWSVAE